MFIFYIRLHRLAVLVLIRCPIDSSSPISVFEVTLEEQERLVPLVRSSQYETYTVVWVINFLISYCWLDTLTLYIDKLVITRV